MRLPIRLVVAAASLAGCATAPPQTARSAAPPAPAPAESLTTWRPELLVLERRPFGYFEALEAGAASVGLWRDTTGGPPDRPVSYSYTYRRSDPLEVGIPLEVRYSSRVSDGHTRFLQYRWGPNGGEGPASLPPEQLGTVRGLYEAIRAEVVQELGEPTERTPLTYVLAWTRCRAPTWIQSDLWWDSDPEVRLSMMVYGTEPPPAVPPSSEGEDVLRNSCEGQDGVQVSVSHEE
jgi:hypothetical protein